MQILLTSPDITCDHCLATIRDVLEPIDGVRFLFGDPDSCTFAVDLEAGRALDEIADALESAGYPLGTAAVTPRQQEEHEATWRPSAYRIEGTEAGANVNYDCYCGCDAGFAFDRSLTEQPPESCCCGNWILVGQDAEVGLAATLPAPEDYRIEVRTVTMPWGQPVDVALAIPRTE